MRSFLRPIAAWLALAAAPAAAAGSANVLLQTSGTPPGFADLAGTRELVVDVYFGGNKIGEALATARPGWLRFRSGGDLLAMLPQVIASSEIEAALQSELPTNSAMACGAGNAEHCAVLSPDVLAIILDEDHFRVDLFVAPRFLRVSEPGPRGYLPLPQAPIGLISATGMAASGTFGGETAYNVQNRTIFALRNGRIRANSSLASGLGFVVDDLVGELDRKDMRYSAGLFWAPGSDFIGARRIVGAGVGTQFDTWADRDALHGTPLVLFLAQPARVELLVDGRLISSRSYGAGNIALDTAALPEGSYMVQLRIHGANGAVREDSRFFSKNRQAPPIGHPVFYAFAGLLANTRRHQPISLSDTFYYQAGAAWRISDSIALDVAGMGTQRKAMVAAGAWLIRPQARLRVALLASSEGDSGALLQLASGGGGPVSFNLDVRRIWSHDDRPLIPLSSVVDTFGGNVPTGVQLASGSYTQATGSIGVRLRSAYLAIVGSYRKDHSSAADYSVGPSLNWPVLTASAFQLTLDASAQRTRSTSAAFVGARVLFSSGGFSMLGTLGRGAQAVRGEGGASATRIVGNLGAQYSHEDSDRTLIGLEAGVDRSVETATLHAGGTLYSRFGNLRADVLQNLESRAGAQFGVTVQSGLALSPAAAAVGGRDLEQSAIIVSVAGDAPQAEFQVLIDNAVRGRIKTGARLSLFVPAYRTYRVKLVPTVASSVRYDMAPREVTLYPGNVQNLVWNAEGYFTMFAQATSDDGTPVAGALVKTARSVAETDPNGYFQIDVARHDVMTVVRSDGRSCEIKVPHVAVERDFASAGKLLCQ
jgi:hypothetical protein